MITNRIFNWVNNNFLNLLVLFLIALNIAPIVAPLLIHWGMETPAKVIYDVYSFFCHQQHWKSIHIHDHQVAWCTRDMFIWGSMMIVGLIVKIRRISPLSLFWLIVYSLPVALDGGIQTLAAILGYGSGEAFYVSNNFFRMLTGTLFGTAIGLYMLPRLVQVFTKSNESINEDNMKNGLGESNWRVVLSLVLLMIVVYIFFIHVWRKTSTEFVPSNWIDSEIRIPADREEWFVRRRNGI